MSVPKPKPARTPAQLAAAARNRDFKAARIARGPGRRRPGESWDPIARLMVYKDGRVALMPRDRDHLIAWMAEETLGHSDDCPVCRAFDMAVPRQDRP